MGSLTYLQALTLGALANVGTADASTLGNHLALSGRRIAPVLGSLERGGLVERVHTGHRFPGHAYRLTEKGGAAEHRHFGHEEEL